MSITNLIFNPTNIKPYPSEKYSINIYQLYMFIENEERKYPSLEFKILWDSKSEGEELLEFDVHSSLNPKHCYIAKVYPLNKGTKLLSLEKLLGKEHNDSIEFDLDEGLVECDNCTDITEFFIYKYEKLGMCLFDLEHRNIYKNRNNKQRYRKSINSKYICNWCGKSVNKSPETLYMVSNYK